MEIKELLRFRNDLFEESKDEKNLKLLKDIDVFIQGIRRVYENA